MRGGMLAITTSGARTSSRRTSRPCGLSISRVIERLLRLTCRNCAPSPSFGHGQDEPILAAAHAVDADHVGAEIGQQGGAERSRDVAAQVQNLDALEHTHLITPAIKIDLYTSSGQP